MVSRLGGAAALFLMVAGGLVGLPTPYSNNTRAALYLSSEAPSLDGSSTSWDALQGSSPEKFVYGDYKASKDPSAVFVLRTDNKKLFIFAEVKDSVANENELPAPLAWRNDSVEVYLGTDVSPHNKFSLGDSQIRLVPVSKSDPHVIHISVNDVVIDADPEVQGTVTYTGTGYKIVAALPLRLLRLKAFSIGQPLRAEFQINDAGDAEREALVHWSSKKDNTYYDAGSWGDGVVVSLPEGTKP